MPRWTYPTLRIALAMTVVIVLTSVLGRGINRFLAHRFAKVVAESEQDPEAVYRLLLAMEEEGVDALVVSATSDDPRIAKKARNLLFVRVDTWMTELTADNPSELSKRLDQLVKAVQKYSPELTISGKKWADHFAYRILDLSSRLRVQDRGKIISSVDDLLATIARIPDRVDLIVEETEREIPQTVAKGDDLVENEIPLEPRNLFDPAKEPIASLLIAEDQFLVNGSQHASNPSSKTAPELPENDMAMLWQKPNRPQKDFAEDRLQVRSKGSTPTGEQPSIAFENLNDLLPIEIPQLDDRQLLSLLIDNVDKLIEANSQMPTARGPAGRRINRRNASEQETNEDDIVSPEEERLLALRQTLTERGYSSVQLDQIRLFLSNYPEDRLELVEQLMVSYVGDHSRLLLQLANDPAPEVRLAAITALGSSSQRLLVEAAWKRSLRDTDPRIAALADDLQTRLQN